MGPHLRLRLQEMQSRATANFYDPKLATSFDFPDIPQLTPEGFVVDLDGGPATQDVATLSSLNYKVQPITMPSISSVDPNHGANLKPATLTITGDGFMEGAQVKLVRAGEPDIVGNAVVTKKIASPPHSTLPEKRGDLGTSW